MGNSIVCRQCRPPSACVLLAVCAIIASITSCEKKAPAVDIETTVLASVATIEAAESAYAQANKSPGSTGGTYATLGQLTGAGLIPARLADGFDDGYTYEVEVFDEGRAWALVAVDGSAKGRSYVAGSKLATIYRCSPTTAEQAGPEAEIARLLEVVKSEKLVSPAWTPAR